MPGGFHPQIAAAMRTIITHWSEATGRDIKATRVTTGAVLPSGAARPRLTLPSALPMLQNRVAEAAP